MGYIEELDRWPEFHKLGLQPAQLPGQCHTTRSIAMSSGIYSVAQVRNYARTLIEA